MATVGSAGIEPTEPGIGHGLLDVAKNRFLLHLLVKKELRVRYQASMLGILWSYVKPAVQFVVFYLALGVFLELNKGTEDYAVYLFSGVVVINLFGEAFGNATRSIVGNGALVRKIYLPRQLFPLASLQVAFVHFLPQLLVLVVGTLVAGWRPNLAQLAGGLLAIFIVCTLAFGLGLLFGAVNVMFRDAENFVDLIIMVATWLSPVLYTWDRVANALSDVPWLFTIYQLNPLTAAVELFHWCFWYPATSGTSELPPNMLAFGFAGLAISLLILAFGDFVFRRLEGRFAQEL
ncbi:ABC transporter permease [Cellulosimicrobium protaetiae]|uniref:Transport permease protein n=1 Tax=Cellulosimicrobium protaetiae TaxID=2587808 RepID=A0A6M5UFN5_9MICO|nr:ABC transporter permease [Cellulosimicrobium protaetiae]QJW36101.1 ABC transporter permease [Cellulosimicrobium protaetiae]